MNACANDRYRRYNGLHAAFHFLHFLLHRRWLKQALYVLLCVFIFPILVLVLFNRPVHYNFPIVLPSDVPVFGVRPVEMSEKGWFRWFETRAGMRLSALSATDHLLFLEMHGSGMKSRVLHVRLNDVLVAEITLRPDWHKVSVLLPHHLIRSSENDLSFDIEPLPFDIKGKFGVAIAKLSIVQLDQYNVPISLFMWLMVISAIVSLCIAVLPLPFFDRIIVSTGVTIALGYALSIARLQTVMLLQPIALASFGVLMCLAVYRAGFRLRNLHLSIWHWRLCIIAGLLFVFHVVGMNAPVFIDIDHRARANHVLLISHGGGDAVQRLLSNQYEWNIATIPYSLLSYYPFVLLTVFFPGTSEMTLALKVAVSLINATTPLLLYALLVRSGYQPRAGFLAGALFAGLPMTHLYFHDGSYPTILGVWWMVVTLLIINETIQCARWSWWHMVLVSGVLLVALLIYVTHIVFVPLVIGMSGLAAWHVRSLLRVAGLRVGVALGISLVAALAVYYGQYVAPTVTTLIAQLAESERLGHDRLPSPLVGSLVEQMWGHTRVLPLLLLPIGVVTMARHGWTWTACVVAGYLVLLVVGIVVDHRFSLWNKHWYFCLPALAIVAGIALDRIATYRTAGKIVTSAVVGYLLVESAMAWLLRVFLYQWSLQTL